MHEGLLLPNSEPNEAYHVAAAVARELEAIDAKVESQRADVALVFDYESAFAWKIEPQGQDFVYLDLILDFYGALRRLGLNVDVVAADAGSSGAPQAHRRTGFVCVERGALGSLGGERRGRAARSPQRLQDRGFPAFRRSCRQARSARSSTSPSIASNRCAPALRLLS